MLPKRLYFLAGAAGAGAVVHALKEAVLLAAGTDLSLVPAMSLLFAIGIFGLHVADSRLSLAAIGFQIAGYAPENADAPVGVDVAYALVTFAILVGLLLFAAGFRRARVLDRPWSTIPLTLCRGVVASTCRKSARPDAPSVPRQASDGRFPGPCPLRRRFPRDSHPARALQGLRREGHAGRPRAPSSPWRLASAGLAS